MSIPEPAKRELWNTMILFMPIILLVSVIGWSIDVFIKSNWRKRRKARKKLIKEKVVKGYVGGSTETFNMVKSQIDKDEIIKLLFKHNSKKIRRTTDFIKALKFKEDIEEGFAYCDFCGTKLWSGIEHNTQDCLIKSYKDVIIK